MTRVRYIVKLRAAFGAMALMLLLLLSACEATDRASGASTPTPSYDPFQRHGCQTCDMQQRRIQATNTTVQEP